MDGGKEEDAIILSSQILLDVGHYKILYGVEGKALYLEAVVDTRRDSASNRI
jgi:hypothetical protein